jgi:GT2 family glycosyltransferase
MKTVQSALDDAKFASVGVEVLIVWSGRTEPASWAAGLPAVVRHAFAPKPGVAVARNVALRKARGALVLFTDDDVVCRPGWIEAAYGTWLGGAHVVGGPVVLVWPTGKPAWATSAAASLWAAFDLGGTPFDLQTPQAFVSANMAMERDQALKVGGFSERLGHGAGTSLMGEETDFCMRAIDAGLRLRYEPSAVVEHHVQPEEVSRRKFLSRMYRFGRTMTVLRPPTRSACPILRRAGKALMLSLSAPFTQNPTARFGEAAFLLGETSILALPRRYV